MIKLYVNFDQNFPTWNNYLKQENPDSDLPFDKSPQGNTWVGLTK